MGIEQPLSIRRIPVALDLDAGLVVFERHLQNLHPMKEGDTIPQMRDAKPVWGSSGGSAGPTVIFPGDTMDGFALVFSGVMYNFGRPVVNRTGLPGIYYAFLHWGEDDDPVLSIQEQLGFRFESQKAAVETFVIDHVEKPAPNEP
jgi:uncharacterized protein (TIGR03435 family)